MMMAVHYALTPVLMSLAGFINKRKGAALILLLLPKGLARRAPVRFLCLMHRNDVRLVSWRTPTSGMLDASPCRLVTVSLS
jgi:hypothetical protein